MPNKNVKSTFQVFTIFELQLNKKVEFVENWLGLKIPVFSIFFFVYPDYFKIRYWEEKTWTIDQSLCSEFKIYL